MPNWTILTLKPLSKLRTSEINTRKKITCIIDYHKWSIICKKKNHYLQYQGGGGGASTIIVHVQESTYLEWLLTSPPYTHTLFNLKSSTKSHKHWSDNYVWSHICMPLMDAPVFVNKSFYLADHSLVIPIIGI